MYTDNNAALAEVIKGDSTSVASSYIIATLWRLVASCDIAIWFERLESARNIADLPTRNRPIPFPALEIDSYPRLQEVLSFYNERIAE